MAFIANIGLTTRFAPFQANNICKKVILTSSPTARLGGARMGLGEDGLAQDLKNAQEMISKGSTVEEAKEMMTKLEYRRAILAYEVTKIEDTLETLTKSLHSNDKTVLEQAMEAALNMFKPSEDNYPYTSNPSGYTMDKPKK